MMRTTRDTRAVWGAVLGQFLIVVAVGCGGDDDNGKAQIGPATLRQTGVAWGKLTPIQKKTAVAYCLPPRVIDVSPTRVAAAMNRLYVGAPSSRRRIGAVCTQAVTGLRTAEVAPNPGTSKRVARAQKALVEFCPDDPSFLQPKDVTRRTEQLAVAYEQSPDPAKDRKYVETAVAKLKAGCGPSARLRQALQKTPATKPKQPAKLPGARTLSGNGPKELGDLVIRRSSDLRWTHDGGASYFSMTEEQGRLSFLSDAPRGYRAVPAGVYRAVWIDADGPWTIVTTPR